MARPSTGQWARLQYYSEHTIFEAEATALLLAAHLLATNPEVTYPASIMVDNQAVIQSSERPSSKPGHYLLLNFRNMLHRLTKRERLTRESITLRWIAGHREVEGNKQADEEAKKAAESREASSSPQELPITLRSPLPLSMSALKQQHNTKLASVWKRDWKRSPRYQQTSNIDDQLPSKSFLKLTGKLSKKQTSLYLQLRTSHAPLNQHLHRINRSDTPLCLQCGGTTPENVHHFLFQCPRYNRERHILMRTLRRKATSLPYLLANEEAQVEVIRYVNTTKRLSLTFGVVPTHQPQQ